LINCLTHSGIFESELLIGFFWVFCFFFVHLQQQAEGLIRPDVELLVGGHTNVQDAKIPRRKLHVSLGAHLSNIRDGTAGGQAHAHINGAKLGKKSF